jgi:alpha-L-fucosidase 2
MRIVVRSFLVVFGLFLTFSLRADPGPLSISFNYPGIPGFESSGTATDNKSWYTTGLPIGNGKLVAMVFGGVGTEMIQFNEDTIWCGQPHDYANTTTTPARLSTMQTKCFNFQDISADETYLFSVPSRLPVYECPGGLRLTFPTTGYSGYLRSLNLSNATVNVSYTDTGNSVSYKREIFASAPSNRVIVVRFTTANNSSAITFTCSFTNLQTATYTPVLLNSSNADLVMHADVTYIGDSRYTLANAVKYDARVRLVAAGGTVTTGANSISVTSATNVTLYLSVVSNVKKYNDITADYVTICSNNVATAAALGYDNVRQAQQQDYTNLFNRVVLDLGVNASKTSLDLGARKKQIIADPNDPNLFTLLFQMGRYMLIAGSRPGSQPLNLQGKWNDRHNLYSGWGSKMTLNINEEMNYWGAEVANLAECHEPLFDLIKDLSETGHKVAISNYFCPSTNAWVAHHNTDLWRNAGPVNTTDGYWPAGGAWLCQHLWWHYQYNGDTNWLATNAYPLMKGAAQFFLDFLVPHPTYTHASGQPYMVTCPSHSPEHNYPPTGQYPVPGPTIDNALIRDLFTHVIQASEILGVDGSFRTNVIVMRDKLPPNAIGAGGQLQEWLEDVDSSTDTHRHMSPLVGLFPGDEISPFYTPFLAKAAKVLVDWRGPPTDTPWSRAWRMNLRTRLQDDLYGFRVLTNLLNYQNLSTNLMFSDNSDGAWRQVDGTFGLLSGIAEMFLQSPAGEVCLLPALPPAFTNGSVSGLCARGGFEVDNMTWTNNRLVSATVLSKLGNTCRLRSKWPVDIRLGTNYVDAPMVLPGLYQFSTVAGSNYTVTAANIAETENLSATYSSGDSHAVVTNAAFSNWRGTLLTASATGDYVTYVVSNLTAGTYHLFVGADAGANRGKFQLAAGPNGGALTNVGPVQDTYSATNVVYLLPIKLTTPTNLIVLWTNLLKEFDCGTWTAPADGNYQFKFTVADKNGASSGYNLAPDYIKFTPATSGGSSSSNSAPTDMALSNATVAENQPSGTAVGTFTTTDPDSGDTFTYSLVSGTGSTDNGSFTITNDMLYTAASFNYEAKSSYSIRVRTTDQGSLYYEEAFTITVTNVNETPADVSLSNATVAESQPSGTAVGSFTSTDPDSGDTFTYALVGGTGSTDNSSFTITNNTLYTAAAFNFETKNSYSIRVRTTDQGSLTYEEAFAIAVTNVNEAPVTPANMSPANGAANQSPALVLQASAYSDPDVGDTHAASEWLVWVGSTNVFDSGADSVNKTNLAMAAGALNYGTAYTWQVRYQDNHGLWGGYSTPTAFSTMVPMLGAVGLDGKLVLTWPTNTAGFYLECVTDLLSTNWVPAAPSPVVAGGAYVVTNTFSGEKMLVTT